MDVLRFTFWLLACVFMVPLCFAAWIMLFWLNPEDPDDWEENGDFEGDEEATWPRGAQEGHV